MPIFIFSRSSMWLLAHLAAVFCLFQATASGQTTQNYLIQSNDEVELRVFQEDDMTTKARIGNDGTMNIPLIGRVRVAGKSTEDAAEYVRNELIRQRYFVNPQVTVSISSYNKKRFTVSGQVTKSGQYEMPDNQASVDLVTAVSMAGGTTRLADRGKVTVKRMYQGREQVVVVSLRDIESGKRETVQIFPGDVITVAESAL
jgi:polysaccharide export outer membrane protein